MVTETIQEEIVQEEIEQVILDGQVIEERTVAKTVEHKQEETRISEEKGLAYAEVREETLGLRVVIEEEDDDEAGDGNCSGTLSSIHLSSRHT